VAQPRAAVSLRHDGAALEVGKDAVDRTTTLEARSLCQSGMAPLDQGMTNVTAGPRRGYRFLPGGKFRQNMRISLPYDPDLIPAGLSDDDVRTFYYDEQSASWRALEREAVDSGAKTVHSVTDHFTDFVNATVTVPDHPETASNDPNGMADLESADPGAGINLIDAPQANSQGTAAVEYPIELPPGRLDMAPSLALGYDSNAGNGWLGVGWSLNIPSVGIDTRWGVPRYDAATETETYLLDGAQLSPVAHRGTPQPRTAEKVFHGRVEGDFQRIVRHGTRPADYWWEVTEKDGTRSFYGGDPDTGTQAADSVLADGTGRVFRWALRETRDLRGNSVRYTYDKVSDVGVAGGTVAGTELYPRSVNYTRGAGAAGPYTVTFVRDSELPGYTRRPDVTIDARGGFKMVTAELLARIDVTLDGALVRRYDMSYVEGAFRKSLLRAVTQRGSDAVAFHTHEFSYYDELRDGAGAYAGFATATGWQTGHDNVTAGLLGHGQASAVSGALNTSVGGHLYAGFNPAEPTKQFSAGFKVGYTFTRSDGVLALIDLNGDNLPDKVFQQDGRVRFRLNTSGPDGSTDFGDMREIPTLPAISAEDSHTVSFGAEAYAVANVFANQSETFTTTSTYFSDVNGDGLTDLVDGGRVLFNHLDPNGVPTFTENSADTPVPIGPGAVDTNGIVADYEALFQQQVDTFPLADTLRRWEAPFSGRVAVAGAVALVQDTSPERARYRTADGVRVAIQQDGSELWSTAIEATDYTPKTPSGVDSITVDRGDHLYFRVQSRFDGAYDQVSWEPRIAYLDVNPTTDVNNLDAYRYGGAGDFVLAGRRGASVQVPFNGTVRLAGELRKRGPTTDDIEVQVLRNGVPVFTGGLTAAETAILNVNPSFTVARNDSVQLRVKVDSPIDVSQLEWAPHLFYTVTPDVSPIVDGDGKPLIQLHPPYDVDTYPVDGLTAPQQAWTVPDTGTVTIDPRASAAAGTNGTVVFTVKKRGVRLAKRTLTLTSGTSPDASFSLDVTAGDQLFFDFSVYDPALTVSGSVEVDDDPVPGAVHASANPGLLALPYRGWTYAGYNGNRDRALAPIVEADLERAFEPTSGYDPHTAKAYLFNPVPEQSSWRGPDDLGWVKAGSMSSSRLGPDDISVPRPGDFAGGRAVRRLSQTSQLAVGAGVSLLSGSLSTGTSTGEVDYLDLNGDLFPDIVSDGRVQYTTGNGGLDAANRAIGGLGTPRTVDASAVNVGVGGSPAAFFGSGRGEVDTGGKKPPRSNKTGTQMTPLGLVFEAGLGRGDSAPQFDLVDVNGDLLPDRVTQDGSGLRVALNLGYGFAPAEPWGTAAIDNAASENGSIGVSLGFNGGIYDFAGGASLSKNKSQTSETLLDLNGDGLLDRVLPGGGSGLRVGFNTGNGFAAPVAWSGAQTGICKDDTTVGLAGIDWNNARVCTGDTGLGGGAYFTIGIGPLCTAGCYVITNPGLDGDQSMSRDEGVLRDVDGDGYLDHVASTADNGMTVASNRTGRTNLLKSIDRPLRGTVTLEYQRDGNTVAAPESRWVLSRTTVHDGHPGDGVDTEVMAYEYAGGVYDRREREFYGYGSITGRQVDPATGATYRTQLQQVRTDSFATKGLLAKLVTSDGAGNRFRETEYTYLTRDVTTGTEPAAPDTTDPVFPQLLRTDLRDYEGAAAPGVTTFSTSHYDALGNVDRFTDAGDAGADDDTTTTTTYAGCADSYVVGVPTGTRITGSGGTELRRSEATVDCGTGDLTQVRQFLGDGAAAVTDLEYRTDGNLRAVTDPPNEAGQRYRRQYEYDPVAATHVVSVTDSFGLASTATYDLRFGVADSETDTNGNTTTTVYDGVGRPVSVTGPYQQGGGTPTVRFEYHPDAAVPWARSRHLDSFRSPTDTIDSVVFTDGRKRVVQTKRDLTVHNGPDAAATDVMAVSGRTEFDLAGRPAEVRYPVTEPLGTPGVFNTTVDSEPPTRTTYDVLDRITRITLPDGTSSTAEYGFGPDRAGATRSASTATDPKGYVRRTFTDVRDLVTGVQELHNGQPVWTSYRYDPMEQLVEVADDRNNVTTTSYDNLGRRTAVTNPDTGRTETQFDLSGYPTARITANLRAENERVSYRYDFHRLTGVTYPNFPGNNVTYTYGAPGATENRAGRVILVTDESGANERFYGKLGEIVRETRSIASDTGPEPEVYTTSYTYDTFGRLQSMVYPDGEVLTYAYDSGGLVRAASGVKGPQSYPYVNRLEYDKFARRAFVEAGNGVRTAYTHDPVDRRLANLNTGKPGGNPIQNLEYTYDEVGNIVSLTNDVPEPPPSRDGGPTTQTFVYDDLYRLVSAAGSYRFAPNKTDRYRSTFSYDTIDNLTAKEQVHEIVEPSGGVTPQHKTTYSWAYTYGGPGPHAATHVGDRAYTYDANGNQTGWTADNNGQRRTIVWDEENRIQSVSDNGQEETYKYDAGGQRVIKRGPQGETAYVNQYFTVRNGEIGTKQVFVGSTRLASKLVKDESREKDLYYFHPDHLGSSNYVTNADGEIYQHIEYFPGGETWVDESSNKQRTPYQFSGKELDEETGLYYYGARYYDPRTQAWQSPDPLLESYLDGEPNDGVYHAPNLALYTYAYQNPVRLTDPDGLAPGGGDGDNPPGDSGKSKALVVYNTARYALQVFGSRSPTLTRLTRGYFTQFLPQMRLLLYYTVPIAILAGRLHMIYTFINGKQPINSKYAGKVYRGPGWEEIKKKYGKDVPFTEAGFPDFSDFAEYEVDSTYTDTRQKDFTQARKAARTKYGKKATFPKKHTWHHKENVKTFEYVPSDVHGPVKHSGGIAVREDLKARGILPPEE
jgi:RHS repeat-associated protein